ncbi:MAG: hypothetical protein R3301_12600, partial [Saprospiraceae bacterium]|nr:hypothetical protein [Saprospiraceae bacterium]
MRDHLTWLMFGLVLTIMPGCADTSKTYPESANWTPNPNGDSELALLMREMYDDGIRVKHQILNGRTPRVEVDVSQLYTTDATEPEKVASPEYAVYAEAYLATLDALNGARRDEAV